MTILKSDILIIIPAFNEASVIGNVFAQIQNEGYHNICLIDDGSTDNTREVALQYDVFTLSHPINRGAGAAIQTGIAFAKNEGYPYVLLMDGDGQHLPQDIECMLTKIQETDADIIIGNRFAYSENNVPKKRLVYNKLANIFTNIFCKKNYDDTQSGFRLLNRRAIESLELKSKGFDFCSEMLIVSEKLDLEVAQTPIRVIYTDYSMKKGQNLRVGIRTARSILWQFVFK